ncbi:MAG: penicillin-binding transpeptidase domain-containing protein, partial [Candidatus Nealsonbacteria bacterium]|nr:penicillin-binding transpeptidase domain-containing protein [Candidatus Nealsonbacteria bacterium]
MLDFPFVKFKVKRLNKEIEPQETLLDVLAQKKEKELGISEQKLETPLSQKIFKAILVCFFISIFALFAKTAQLQILEGEELSQLSQQNQFVVRSIEAQRGVIYDTNLKQLVFNKPSFDLICRIADLPDDENQRDDILKEVAQILQMDSEDLAEKIKKANAPELLIAKDISHEALILFEAKHYELPGFESKNNSVREYLSGPVFSRLIGYQRKTGEKEGIEAYYDDVLQAQSGKLQVERDVHGNPISKEIISQPLSGQSLVLYLDAELQNSLYQSLKAVISKAGAKSGAAVALSPETGGVLAMVSFPDFDNNLFSQGMTQEEWQKINSDPQKPLFNRVISGIGYPTGSTIKPLIGIAALEEG